jgi:hypothetical protein
VLAPDEAQTGLDAVARRRQQLLDLRLAVGLGEAGLGPSSASTSACTAEIVMSSRSPFAPVTDQRPGPSTSRQGADIQFRAFEPASAWIRIVPSALTTRSRVASGRWALRRPA